MMILSFVCSSLSSLSSSARLHHSFSLWWWYHPLFLKAHKIVPSFSVHRTKVRRRRLSGKGERSRWRGRLILSINPKKQFHRSRLFSSHKVSLTLSLSQRGRKREKKTKNDERRRRKTTSVAMMRVCVLPARVNKKGWSVVRRRKNAFFLVFFFSHKKKGKKKRTIV